MVRSKTKKKTQKRKKTQKKKKPYSRKKKLNYLKPYRCELVICTHEKCHHIKFIDFLRNQKIKHNFNFFASLLPYNKVYHPKTYGIINGMPDFYIPMKIHDYIGIYIELKTGSGVLTKDEKIEMKKIKDRGEALIAVCFGWKACKKLVLACINKEPLETIKELSFKGKIKDNAI